MKKNYYINGMHCKACELLVKKSCCDIPGCRIDAVSSKNGTLTIDWKGHENYGVLEKRIEKCGYRLCTEGNQAGVVKMKAPLLDRICLLFAALVLTIVVVKMDLFGGLLSMQTNASLPVIFVLGLVASVSSCLAVTGGIIIGFTELIDKSKGWIGHVKLHASFQGGRIVGFFVLGSLLGIVGQGMSIGFGFASWFNALIAIILLYLGAQLLGFVPSLSSMGIHLPEKWTKHILTQRNAFFAPLVGALTFFLPCGFTQSVQLMALASGNRLMGGLMMMFFALGTMPGLLSLGMGTSFAKDHRKQGFEQVVAVILLVFGFFTLRGSASIWGITDSLASQNTLAGSSKKEIVAVDDADNAVEKISLSHDGRQLVPETTTLKAGKNYEITIIPASDGLGCMSTIKLPRLDGRIERVVKGQPIVYNLMNVQAGQYSFICGSMGMNQGKLLVQ